MSNLPVYFPICLSTNIFSYHINVLSILSFHLNVFLSTYLPIRQMFICTVNRNPLSLCTHRQVHGLLHALQGRRGPQGRQRRHRHHQDQADHPVRGLVPYWVQGIEIE